MKAGQGDLRTIANGLIPAGFDAAALPPEGRDEVRAAIDVILRLSDYRDAKLGLALEQLDKAADEIERLRAEPTLSDFLDYVTEVYGSGHPAHVAATMFVDRRNTQALERPAKEGK